MALQQPSSENENRYTQFINTSAHFFAQNEPNFEPTFEQNFEQFCEQLTRLMAKNFNIQRSLVTYNEHVGDGRERLIALLQKNHLADENTTVSAVEDMAKKVQLTDRKKIDRSEKYDPNHGDIGADIKERE